MRRIICIVALAACHSQNRGRTVIELGSAPKEGEVVAVVGGSVITAEELRARLQASDPDFRTHYHDPKALHDYVDNQIRFELLTQAAQRKGFDKDPEVQEAARKIMIQKLLKEVLDTQLRLSDVPEAEVDQFYKTHLGDYQQAERGRFGAISFSSRGEASEAFATIRKRPASFAEVQAKHGGAAIDESQFFSLEELAAKVGEKPAEQAMAIRELGQLAPALETSSGFLLVKLTGRKAALKRPLEDVRDNIRQRIFRDERAHLFDEYVQRLRVEMDVTTVDANFSKVLE